MPRRPSRRSHRRGRQIALSLWGLAALASFLFAAWAAARATVPGEQPRERVAVATVEAGGDDHAADRLVPWDSPLPAAAVSVAALVGSALVVLAPRVTPAPVQVFVARLRGPPPSVFVLHP